jgi:hypothetical protein
MDRNKADLHRQRGHESSEAAIMNWGLGASRLTTDRMVVLALGCLSERRRR